MRFQFFVYTSIRDASAKKKKNFDNYARPELADVAKLSTR